MSRSSLGEWASQRVGAAIRELLETKHLYQSLSLDETRIVAEAAEAGFAAEEQAKIVAALKGEWVALDEITVQRVVAPSSWDMFDAPPPQVCFMVISIKAACAECRGVTPFNLVRPIDLFGGDPSWRKLDTLADHQDFVFLFECQSCRSCPESFLVRRRGLKVTLAGRSPMEFVQVPSGLPNSVSDYYSGAVVAFQSGQVLAAIFLLRVLIEQFVKSVLPQPAPRKADEALDRYRQGLDADFKDRFPSLSDVYAQLSNAIHTAKPDTTLYSESRCRIVLHFEARDLYKRSRAGRAHAP